MIKRKVIGFIPFVLSDEHQGIIREGLKKHKYLPKRIRYFPLFPLTSSLLVRWDCLYLDWVHSFYTSKSLTLTRIKSLFGPIDRYLFRKLKNKRLAIWNVHNLSRHDKLHINIEYRQLKNLYNVVDCVRFFSESNKMVAIQYFKWPADDKKYIIPQPCYNTDLILRSSRKETATIINLLFFGSIREGKGVEQLLKDVANIKSPQIKIIFAGKHQADNLSILLKTMASDNPLIEVIDKRIAEDELPTLINRSNALIIPYENVLNSGVVTWSLSCDLPVIISDLPTFDYVSSYPFCFKYTLGDSNSLRNAVIMSQKVNSEDLIQSKKMALSNSAPSKVIGQLVDLMESRWRK